MITNRKPESKTLVAKNVKDILCETNDIYAIESILQRDYVWDLKNCETLWSDILDCVRINLENEQESNRFVEKKHKKAYINIGALEHSTLDKCNEKYNNENDDITYKSMVDGSQRLRTVAIILIALSYAICREKGEEKIDMSFLKNEYNKYKLIEIGVDKLKNFYDVVETTTIKEIDKRCKKKSGSIFKKFTDENKEREYFDIFVLFDTLIKRDVIDKYSPYDIIDIVLNNIYFNEEYIDPIYKFDRFVDRNKKGTPMSDSEIYPKYIINQFKEGKENIYNAFVRFKTRAYEAEFTKDIPHSFRPTKTNIHSMEFVMIQVLKIKLAERYKYYGDVDLKKVFKTLFRLDNIDYGIEQCFKKELLFNTVDEAIDYFDTCYNFIDYVINNNFKQHNDIHKDTYYLRDFGEQNLVWWFFLMPLYISENRFSENVNLYNFIRSAYARIYAYYVVHRVNDTNVQKVMDLLENISCLLIIIDDKMEIMNEIRRLFGEYVSKTGGYEQLAQQIHFLNYGDKTQTKQKGAIDMIFKSYEYAIIERLGLSTEGFYTLWEKNKNKKNKNKGYNTDHWYPKNKFENDENAHRYTQIGNMVLLEDSLNKSKQDNNEKNSKIYAQSNYFHTLLLEKDNRGILTNHQIDIINKEFPITRLSEYDVNNPSLENISKRTEDFKKFFVKFIRDFIENDEYSDYSLEENNI